MANELQATKWLSVAPPKAISDNAAVATTEIDTAGFDHCTIAVYIGATDIALAVCKVQESDTSGSGMADISGLDSDGDTNTAGSAATLPTATDDNKMILFEIDMRGRKRYLDLALTTGDGTAGSFVTAIAVLYRGGLSPGNVTAKRGDVLDVLRV